MQSFVVFQLCWSVDNGLSKTLPLITDETVTGLAVGGSWFFAVQAEVLGTTVKPHRASVDVIVTIKIFWGLRRFALTSAQNGFAKQNWRASSDALSVREGNPQIPTTLHNG